MKDFYDISVRLDNSTLKYPEDPEYSLKQIASSRENGYNLNKVSLSLHYGTHIDFPYHFFDNGKRSSDYSVEDFFLHALVIDCRRKQNITTEDFSSIDFVNIQAVLFKTDNSALLQEPEVSKNYCNLTQEAASELTKQNIKLVGIDYINIDSATDSEFNTHKILLSNNILILETIDLGNIESGKYELICLPLKLQDTEASPVRAVLYKKVN